MPKKKVGFSQKEEDVRFSPPKVFTRNEYGLVEDDDTKYVFTDEGLIDWRKMVKPEYLVSNRQRTKELDVTKLEDRDLLILLGGIKELAQIRGYTDLTYNVVSPSADYVIATCTITWTPNYETEGRTVKFSAIGDASPGNTKSFARNFLGPIAENRAFVRCVRNFLRIHIVGSDEMGDVKMGSEPVQESAADPKALLKSLMKDKGITFENVKSKLEKESYDGAENFSAIEDIPNIKIFELIERMKKV